MKKHMFLYIIIISILICSFYAFYDIKMNYRKYSTSTTEYTLDNKENDKEDNRVESNINDNDKNEVPDTNINIEKDNNIFGDYEMVAREKLNELTIDEKIAQTLLVRNSDALQTDQEQYQFGGIVFFEKDFKNKSKEEVITMISNLQNKSKIPLLTAIDEEGGKVSRISSNKNLTPKPFKSSHDLYESGGFDAIKNDTLLKSTILSSLGLNLNLAPVVDISTNESDYIYNRTIGLSAEDTGKFAKTVIEISKAESVSYTLKHFPGYGNNADTHKGISIDTRTYEDIINNDLIPFKEGIKAGAEAIMVSHNIVTSIDSNYPSTLSKPIHDLLRNDLKFTGVIITDDLSMAALDEYDNTEVLAIKAGNDLLITSDYKTSFQNIKNGLANNLITEEELNNIVIRILSWKYYKKLL